MKYPFASFAISLVIYFSLILLFALVILKKTQMPAISLEIDAEVVGNVVQHEKSKIKTSEKKDSQKISDEKKSREEKLEPDEANNDKESQNLETKNISQKVAPLHQPLPEIPDELRFEAFNSSAVARFYITPEGNVSSVDLIRPCNNPRLNQLLIKSLKSWKFAPSKMSSTQDIRVNFKVE